MKKKTLALCLSIVLAMSVSACGNSQAEKETPAKETTIDKTVEKKSKPAKAEDNNKSKSAEKSDATDKAEKKNSQAEKPKDNKAESDKSDKDKGSANNSNSSISKPNSGNANNNGSASKPSTPAKPNKPSSGNNSGSSNNGNHNGSVNKPSKPSEPSKPTEKPASPQKPAEPETPAPHVCSFDIVVSTNPGNCQTASSTVKKCSCGKTTTVNGGFGSHNMVHHDAQGHEVTDYEKHYICNQCGADFGLDADTAGKHTIVTQGCQNYSLKPVPVGSHWEETSPAYDECSICGKR